MNDHIARFPGITNDPSLHNLTERQAKRLASITALPTAELVGRPLVKIIERLHPLIDPKLLFSRRLCGRVVKPQANGEPLPVPFATVHVYDTDLRLLAWSPTGSPYSWFHPFGRKRELLATVTTDECGRFCVWVPRFDIDHYLRWRLERRCYLEWLRRPTLLDVLRERRVIPRPGPDPDPAPVVIDEHVLTHAARVVEGPALARLRELAVAARIGAPKAQADAVLARPAFEGQLRPPMPTDLIKALRPELRPRLAARLGLHEDALAKLDPRRFFGPFLRCRDVLVPQWTTIIDVPDLTFEVTQDVNSDGQQETIYSESLFDVRWNAGNIGEIVLQADPIAVTSPTCNVPDIGPCGVPAILFAGNYPLQVPDTTPTPGTAGPIHDAITGYAMCPNRPDANGVPGGNDRLLPAEAPFTGSFYLVGCAERPGATYYRVHHEVGGISSFLSGGGISLRKVDASGTLLKKDVVPVDGQWYPIVPRSEGWTPVGLLARVEEAGNHRHTFHLEFGQVVGATIQAIPNSTTTPVSVHIDTTAPRVDLLELSWRAPDATASWTPLPIADCAVVARSGAQRVQLRLRFTVSANHLRDFAVTASGCGPTVAPGLVSDRPSTLATPALDAAAHWHTGEADDAHSRDLVYELPANAPAGCYHFSIKAVSRAFDPNEAVQGPDDAEAWTIDREPIRVIPSFSVALQ